MYKKRVTVDVSDARVSANPEDVLATFSLGSCVALCLYDCSLGIGGLIHYQLPDARMNPEKAETLPYMFADTGITKLVEKMVSMGANKRRMIVKAAGGAAMQSGPQGFDIGKRNYLALRKIMWKNGMFIDAEEIGGNTPRNMYLSIADGAVTIRSNGLEKKL